MPKTSRISQLVLLLAGMLSVPTNSSGSYVSNAFVLKNSSNDSLLVNRDLNCVQLDEKTGSATFGLSEGARRFFYQYTKENAKTDLITEICGRQISKTKIMQTISSGVLTVNNLKETEFSCLKASFDLSEACQDCPVCKNYRGGENDQPGFKLSIVEPDSIYKLIGLQTGDVVLTINGKRLESSGGAMTALNELKGSKTLKVDFIRDGQRRTLTHSFGGR